MSSQHGPDIPPSDTEDPLSEIKSPSPPVVRSDPPGPTGASELDRILDGAPQDAHYCADSVGTTGNFDSLSLFSPELEGKIEEPRRPLAPERDAPKYFPAFKVRASPKSLDNERVTVEGLRLQVRQTETAIKQSQADVTALKADLEQIHHLAVELTRKYNGIEETARETSEHAATVVETVRDIEKRVGPLVALHELSRNTNERLTALNGLAEEVLHKAKALEGQRDVLERAFVEANRAIEMMCALETRLAELRDRLPLIAHTETMRDRIEQAAAKTTRFHQHLRSAREWEPRSLLRLRLILRHRVAVIAGLAVLVLVSFIVTRPSRDAGQIASKPVAAPAQQGALASPAPRLSGSVLSSAPPAEPARTTLAQPSFDLRPVKATARSRAFIGTLAVRSDPAGALVFIDRRRVGTTPLRLRRLPAGSHVVWIEREGYQRWTAAVLVSADKVTPVDVRLRRGSLDK